MQGAGRERHKEPRCRARGLERGCEPLPWLPSTYGSSSPGDWHAACAACTPLCYSWGASQPSLSTAMLKPSHLLILGLCGEGNSTSPSLVPLPTRSKSERTRRWYQWVQLSCRHRREPVLPQMQPWLGPLMPEKRHACSAAVRQTLQ